MTKLQKSLMRAGRDLGLRGQAPYRLDLPSGGEILAQALLPELGAPNGMLVVISLSDLGGMADHLLKAGYGYSVMDEPLPQETYDLDSFIEVFTDWGWAADASTKPEWMLK
jgi:hypothetical protein